MKKELDRLNAITLRTTILSTITAILAIIIDNKFFYIATICATSIYIFYLASIITKYSNLIEEQKLLIDERDEELEKIIEKFQEIENTKKEN